MKRNHFLGFLEYGIRTNNAMEIPFAALILLLSTKVCGFGVSVSMFMYLIRQTYVDTCNHYGMIREIVMFK